MVFSSSFSTQQMGALIFDRVSLNTLWLLDSKNRPSVRCTAAGVRAVHRAGRADTKKKEITAFIHLFRVSCRPFWLSSGGGAFECASY